MWSSTKLTRGRVKGKKKMGRQHEATLIQKVPYIIHRSRCHRLKAVCSAVEYMVSFCVRDLTLRV